MTQKVSLIVAGAKHELTPEQIQKLGRDVGSGLAHDMAAPPNVSWETLGQQLAPPPKPHAETRKAEGWLRVMLNANKPNVLRNRIILFEFALFSVCCVLAILGALPFGLITNRTIGPLLLGIVGLILLIVVASRWLEWLSDRHIGQWREKMKFWNSLYYCARDDLIFEQGKDVALAPADVRKMLSLEPEDAGELYPA